MPVETYRRWFKFFHFCRVQDIFTAAIEWRIAHREVILRPVAFLQVYVI